MRRALRMIWQASASRSRLPRRRPASPLALQVHWTPRPADVRAAAASPTDRPCSETLSSDSALGPDLGPRSGWAGGSPVRLPRSFVSPVSASAQSFQASLGAVPPDTAHPSTKTGPPRDAVSHSFRISRAILRPLRLRRCTPGIAFWSYRPAGRMVLVITVGGPRYRGFCGFSSAIVRFSLSPGSDRNARGTIVYCAIPKRPGDGGPRGSAGLSPSTQTPAGVDRGLARSR